MTCHPRQSDYVRADHLVTGPGFDLGDGNYTGQEVEMVKNLTYFVAEEFASRTFDSCKNVQFPPVSDTIMFMLCGSWGSRFCTPRRWWDFLGSVDNGYSPFAISYDYGVKANTSEDGHYYHNPDVLSCDEIAPGYNDSCSCSNCPESCTIGKPDFKSKDLVGDWKLAGMNGVGFIMIFVFTGLSCIFILLPVVAKSNSISIVNSTSTSMVSLRSSLRSGESWW